MGRSIDESFAPKIAEITAGSFRWKEPPEIQGSGYVVRSLEAALWAFNKSDNFRDGALRAVNLGDDADTTGAVYGKSPARFMERTAFLRDGTRSWRCAN